MSKVCLERKLLEVAMAQYADKVVKNVLVSCVSKDDSDTIKNNWKLDCRLKMFSGAVELVGAQYSVLYSEGEFILMSILVRGNKRYRIYVGLLGSDDDVVVGSSTLNPYESLKRTAHMLRTLDFSNETLCE